MRNMDLTDASQSNGVVREPVLPLIQALLDRGANVNARLTREPPSRRWMMPFGARLWVNPAQLNSGVAVRMWMIPPAFWIRSMIGWSYFATSSISASDPCFHERPAIGCSSFAATHTPSRGRGASPFPR